MLCRDAGFSPVFVRYNTGRPVAVNGRLLAEALDDLVRRWPTPVSEVLLVGHSMGGLVARSACTEHPSWLPLVRHVICLGTPHQGAPLAKLAEIVARALSVVDLPATRITAKILAARSAGIQDLQQGLPDVPPVPGVRYTFLVGTATADPDHPAAHVVGDGMVRKPSAASPAEGFPSETHAFGGVPHHRMQCDPAVYAHLLGVWTASERARTGV